MAKIRPPHARGGHVQPGSHGPRMNVHIPENVGPNRPPVVVEEAGAVYQATPGWVYIWSDDPARVIHARMGEASPKIVDGYSKWELVDIPHGEALTQWNGSNPLAIELSLVWDGWRSGVSVENGVTKLEKMAGLGREDRVPAMLHWSGNYRHDYQHDPDIDWYIETVDWGDNMGEEGLTLRENVTVTIRAFNGGEYIKKTKKKKRSSGGSKSKKKCRAKVKAYRVKHSDVKGGLAGIAKKLMGDRDCWRAIAKTNKIRDPRKIHAGQYLKMPK